MSEMPWRRRLPGRRWVWPLTVLAAALAVMLLSRPGPAPVLAERLPDFRLPDLLAPGDVLASASLAGRPTLLNVWATWCVPCRQEHDRLMVVSAEGAVELVGINWRDRQEDARRWLAQLGNPYARVGFDGDGAVGEAMGVQGAPETLLVAPDGRIVHRHVGPLTADAWRQRFAPLLAAMEARP